MMRKHSLGGWLVSLLLVLAFASAQAVAAPPAEEEKPPAIVAAKLLKPAPGDGALRKLLIARYNTALEELKIRYRLPLGDQEALDGLIDVAKRVVASKLELSSKLADEITVRQQYLELVTEVERIYQNLVEGGVRTRIDLKKARYLRLDAEIQLLRAKAKAKRKAK
jgi:hypothetical protein